MNRPPDGGFFTPGDNRMDIAVSDRLMPITDVCAATGYKKPTIYEWMRDGKFPRPVKIGRSVRWPSSEVDAWIKDKITSCPRSGQQ
ncbi:AlpA family transcriptional regulator [Cronobacter sakazakii]|uniref:helix-turn-helix transcriptional regulator n=1 Tax=Cronobacter sakazakii TaxID=28141 RepID=UPI0030DCF6F9